MAFNNFRFAIVIRTVLLAVAIFMALYSSQQEGWYVTSVVSIIISIGITIEIIRYAEKYKRSLTDFLISIKTKDFISTAQVSRGSKNILNEAYQIILNEFKNIRIDKEVQYQYLKTLIEHIRTALLSFDDKGKIEFINKTAKELLNIGTKQNINKIDLLDHNLYNLIKALKSGENKVIKIRINNELMHLSVYATEFKILNKSIKLISIQNIRHELEYQELESWQKLIRVLTHEIMNSVTPISSLSEAINESLNDVKGNKKELNKLSDEDVEDMISGLKTIENRSKGLLKFVTSYKQLTRIPKPDFVKVNLVELVNHCITLLKPSLNEHKIEFHIEKTAENIICLADYDQIEQVVINILINAIDAVKEISKPKIIIEIIESKTNKHQIKILDNGKGIDQDELDKIFIPFYTTKKEGSGIGLSLSRQIMRIHKGTISVQSESGKGTEISLYFH